MMIRTTIWLVGLVALLTTACKREEPKPNVTEINATVVNDDRTPLSKIPIYVTGLTGSYFTGTRRDTIFATLATDSTGKIQYKNQIDPVWRVYLTAVGAPAYNDSRYEGTVDGVVNVGKVNNITIILFRR